jgi:hypothetical protein
MAAKKKPKDSTAALAADEGAVIPRLALGEMGFPGLKNYNGRIAEEVNAAFQFPRFFCTIEEMRRTAIIASALGAYKFLISSVQWPVVPPVGATDEQIARAKYVESLKDDMEISWDDFIADTFEYIPYGHSVQEKVWRRRLLKNGSRFNDGKVGLRKLSPRAQETLTKWEFSEDGRDLLAVYQSLSRMQNGHLYTNNAIDGMIRIPREKFLLFTADSTRGNPLGNSILKGVYLAYKQMSMLKDTEILGIAKEAAGLPLIRIPAKYMAADASDEDKQVYEACKLILKNLSNGTSEGIVFPTAIDQDSKKDMFDISLLEKKGVNGANIDVVIRRYQDEILSALSVDILKAGSNIGSFSFADGDTNVLALAIRHRLNEIANVLNNDLIPSIFKMNGWTDEILPRFVPSDISKQSLDELGKFIQRTASVGLVEVSRNVLNKVNDALGVPLEPSDKPVDKENLSMATSNGGEGMKTAGEGTAKKPGAKDSSTQNSENAS